LKKNVELNSFRNIKLFKKALGSKTDSLHLYKLERNNPGANRIFYEHVAESKHEVVEVCALDGFISEFPRVDLLKIDVEGFEMYVLNGALASIQKWKPILYIELAEINQRQHGFSSIQLMEYIENLNYDVKDARTMQSIDKSRTDYHTDILCFYRTQ
jgi:FkbM family methyltransferase